MGQRHDPAAFYSQEKNGTHCTEGCVGLRADGNRCENLAPTRIRYLYRPKSSQSLYRLSYPAHIDGVEETNISYPYENLNPGLCSP